MLLNVTYCDDENYDFIQDCKRMQKVLPEGVQF